MFVSQKKTLLSAFQTHEHMLCFWFACVWFLTLIIFFRNNLTVVDLVMVHGQGTRESLKLAGKHPGPGSSLRFKMTEALLKDCSESECVHGLILIIINKNTYSNWLTLWSWLLPTSFFKMRFWNSRLFKMLKSVPSTYIDYVRNSLSSLCFSSTHDCGFVSSCEFLLQYTNLSQCVPDILQLKNYNINLCIHYEFF